MLLDAAYASYASAFVITPDIIFSREIHAIREIAERAL